MMVPGVMYCLLLRHQAHRVRQSRHLELGSLRPRLAGVGGAACLVACFENHHPLAVFREVGRCNEPVQLPSRNACRLYCLRFLIFHNHPAAIGPYRYCRVRKLSTDNDMRRMSQRSKYDVFGPIRTGESQPAYRPAGRFLHPNQGRPAPPDPLHRSHRDRCRAGIQRVFPG